jgi:hypothetical protein
VPSGPRVTAADEFVVIAENWTLAGRSVAALALFDQMRARRSTSAPARRRRQSRLTVEPIPMSVAPETEVQAINALDDARARIEHNLLHGGEGELYR